MATLADTEIEIFGKVTKVDSNGFISAPNGESFKAFVPRSLFKGRRVNMAQMLEQVADLFRQGKTGSEIAAIADKDSDTIGKYKKIILAFGGIDANAIMQKREQEGEFRNEKSAAMLARFPEVAEWQARLKSKPKASRKNIKSKLNCLNRVCQAVKISPIGLLQKGYTGNEQLAAIDDLMAQAHKTTITSVSSFYACRMAIRSWVAYNGIVIPKPCTYGHLHGEVPESHGQAAHVRMSKQEIAQANAILEDPKSELPYPERRIDTEVFFKFGVETCARQMAIITAKIGDVQTYGGYNSAEQTFKVIERKLYHVGKHRMVKRLFCIELVRIINARQKAGETCLIGKPNEYVNYATMEQESTDDVKQNRKQVLALKEIDDNLRAVYEQVGGNAADPYFTKKPSHSLRHVGAQYWLRKSNFDFGFVAELGGWTTLQELQKSYGGMPKEVFDAKYDEYIDNDK